MLTHEELVALSHTLRHERTLSVYIDGAVRDPASKRGWRLALDRSLKDLRTWLAGSSHDEREELERCVATLEKELADFPGAIGAPGWAAFITRGGTQDAHPLPVQTPTLAVWSTGPCIAPYVRALKQTRPVVIVLADARKADIYRYRRGALEHLETLRAHAITEPPSHMGDAPPAGFHVGVRGETGRDAAQRDLLAGTRRLLAQATVHAVERAGSDGWILIGGIPAVRTRLARVAARLAPQRVMALDSLDVHASQAELEAAARRGASLLRDASDARELELILENAARDSLVALGPAATREALDQARVRTLFLTERYLEDHTAEAEDAVRAALDQGAGVEQVMRAPAERLDEHGGLAARLRFRIQQGDLTAEEVEPGRAVVPPAAAETGR